MKKNDLYKSWLELFLGFNRILVSDIFKVSGRVNELPDRTGVFQVPKRGTVQSQEELDELKYGLNTSLLDFERYLSETISMGESLLEALNDTIDLWKLQGNQRYWDYQRQFDSLQISIAQSYRAQDSAMECGDVKTWQKNQVVVEGDKMKLSKLYDQFVVDNAKYDMNMKNIIKELEEKQGYYDLFVELHQLSLRIRHIEYISNCGMYRIFIC